MQTHTAAVWRWGLAALVLGTVLTRLPFMTQALYAFDSANYALAVRDYYNVAHHRPHPPGYPLYVGFAKGIDFVVHDANRALVLEGILLSALAVGATALVARAWYGRAAGLLAGLLLLFTVGFWGYGEVAYPYVALAAEAATLALLAQRTLAGNRGAAVWFGLAFGVSAGIRWDGAVFNVPLWLWALAVVPWRQRVLSVALAAAVCLSWAIPMVLLTGGWDAYRGALVDYLQVWAPQSAYVAGFDGGGETQAAYNLNFFVNYARQMLGVGILAVFYVVGRRFGPGKLATDQRSRFLVVWTVPPMLVYVFAHLGEAGYVLSLAPQAAILATVAVLDLGDEARSATAALRARGWRWLPRPAVVGPSVAALLVMGVIGWNVQAFARGVGPGRLPDLRAHDATVTAQVDFLRAQDPARTLVLAHDVLRQVEYYLPGMPLRLLYSEYVPGWELARTRTEIPAGVTQVVVLDAGVQPPPEQASRLRELQLRESPPVAVWVVDVQGERTVEHGYRSLRLEP